VSLALDRPALSVREQRAVARAYLRLSRLLARAAAHGDELLARRLLVRREALLTALGGPEGAPMRAIQSEVRALEGQTMVALGVMPSPVGRRGPRPGAAV
jgi:hypothetical protein